MHACQAIGSKEFPESSAALQALDLQHVSNPYNYGGSKNSKRQVLNHKAGILNSQEAQDGKESAAMEGRHDLPRLHGGVTG